MTALSLLLTIQAFAVPAASAPLDPDAAIRLFDKRLDNNDETGALEALDTVVQALAAPAAAGTTNPEAAIRLYDQSLARGDVIGAWKALNAAVAAHPDSYPLMLRYAYAYYLLKDYRSAEQYYKHARELAPDEDAPLVGLFIVAQARNDPAWKAYANRALDLNPSNRDANFALAYDHLARKEHKEALMHFQAVLKQLPNDPDALTGQGWCRYHLDDRKKAHDDFSKALAARPKSVSARQGLYLSRDFTKGLGVCYASPDYHGNPYKRSGMYRGLLISLGYKKLAASLASSETRIGWAPPTPDTVQKDINVALTYTPGPWDTVWAAADAINSNDPLTDGGRVVTLGYLKSRMIEESDTSLTILFVGSHSRYRNQTMLQAMPRLGVGRGLFYGELFGYRIRDTKADRNFTAWGAAGAVGPAKGFTLNARKYFGKKRAAVEEGGTVVYNSITDTYTGGWQVGVSWSGRSPFSGFLSYLVDDMLAEYGSQRIRYRAAVWVAGVNMKFGY